MRHFTTYILPLGQEEWWEYPILSQKSSDYLRRIIENVFGGKVVEGGINTDFGSVLAFLRPCPAVSSETLTYLTEQTAAVLMTKGEPLAVYGPANEVKEAVEHEDYSGFEAVEAPAGDAACVTDTYSAYKAQELIRERVNTHHMKSGVMIVSPQTTFISPDAVIGRGTVILPGCMIYSGTSIGENCKIGPNCLLEQANIGDNTSVNEAQIKESKVGSNCTVGPFCWIRPGCDVGDNVRLGDFVELKKAMIGEGTKVSHLTYIGDAEFGKHINVGCGVVVSNYDGKRKSKTIVGDNSFVGCNVNLVAPVEVEHDVYIAAGTTVSGHVDPGVLAIGRCRPEFKPDWVEKRRKEGKL